MDLLKRRIPKRRVPKESVVLAIVGSRDFEESSLLFEECNKLKETYRITKVVSGEARGADRYGKYWARDNKIKYEGFPADWETYGKSAGHIRNKDIVNSADVLIAFWDGLSKGTANSIELAHNRGIPTIIVLFGDKVDPIEDKLEEWI